MTNQPDRRKGERRIFHSRHQDHPSPPAPADDTCSACKEIIYNRRTTSDRRQGDAVYWKARYDALLAVARELDAWASALADMPELFESQTKIMIEEARAKFAALESKEQNGST